MVDRQRHTGSGWWAGEIGHGFPVFRAGMREGWTNHQTAMGQRQAQVAKHRADHTATGRTTGRSGTHTASGWQASSGRNASGRKKKLLPLPLPLPHLPPAVTPGSRTPLPDAPTGMQVPQLRAWRPVRRPASRPRRTANGQTAAIRPALAG